MFLFFFITAVNIRSNYFGKIKNEMIMERRKVYVPETMIKGKKGYVEGFYVPETYVKN